MKIILVSFLWQKEGQRKLSQRSKECFIHSLKQVTLKEDVSAKSTFFIFLY